MTSGAEGRPGSELPHGPDPSALPYRDAVGILVFGPEGRILVGQRLRGAVGSWQPPQGGIDPGETPLEAAHRELLEETGIRSVRYLGGTDDWLTYDLPDDLEHPPRWAARYRGQRQRWIAFRFTGDESEIDLATEHPEFSAWRWAPLDELPTLGVAFKRPVYARIAAEFAGLAASLAADEDAAPGGPT